MLRDKTPAAASCDTAALQRNLAFGQKYNITGTPTLIFADGTPRARRHSAGAGRKAPGRCQQSSPDALAGTPRRAPLSTAPSALPVCHARSKTAAAVHYRVQAADLHAHLFAVTLTLARPAALQQRVAAGVDSGQLPGARVRQEPAAAARAPGPPRAADPAARQAELANRLRRAGKPLVLQLRGLRLRPLGAHRLARRRRAASSTPPACACASRARPTQPQRWTSSLLKP